MIRLSSRKLHVLSEPIADPFVARVTTNGSLPASMRDSEVLLLDTWSPGVGVDGFRGLLLRHAPVDPAGLPPNAIVLPPELGYLGDGDVLRISPADHALAVLYRRRSPFNALLVTERCNHLCLMCSQPPKVADDSYLVDALIGAIPLFARDSPEICITGGEPTLLGSRFLDLVRAAVRPVGHHGGEAPGSTPGASRFVLPTRPRYFERGEDHSGRVAPERHRGRGHLVVRVVEEC